jgi:uncharacterized RDD family membrane protein YckC
MIRRRSSANSDIPGTRAGIVTRTAAAVIDLGTVLVAMLALYFATAGLFFVLGPRNFSFPQLSALRLSLLGEALMFFYLWLAWMNTGRTLGKYVMGLRLVDPVGRLVRPSRAALRAAFCSVFPLGLFLCALDRKNRALHDLVLRTAVVYDWSLRTAGQQLTEAGELGPGEPAEVA